MSVWVTDSSRYVQGDDPRSRYVQSSRAGSVTPSHTLLLHVGRGAVSGAFREMGNVLDSNGDARKERREAATAVSQQGRETCLCLEKESKEGRRSKRKDKESPSLCLVSCRRREKWDAQRSRSGNDLDLVYGGRKTRQGKLRKQKPGR